MPAFSKLTLVRLSPLVFVTVAIAVWINDVQAGGPYVARNLLPLLLVVVLAWVALIRGGGRWAGRGWRLPLGTVGFAIPALGLSSYLHYAYSVNLNGLFEEGAGQLFRFLPLYTIVAGGIGFAIGWIVGRNV